MNRKEAIEKIKKAYENKELGYQRGAINCFYYDGKTDSCCAVGVLVKNQELITHGSQSLPFIGTDEPIIGGAMKDRGITELYGLTMDELTGLQVNHDILVGDEDYDDTDFVEYLYGLEY